MSYVPSAADVKTLREATQAGMLDCKKALVENEGDLEKSKDWLRTKGLASAAKKSDRAANAGLCLSYLSPDGTLGALVEVACETDFVAKLESFQQFVLDLAKLIAEENPTGVEDPADWNVAGESLLNTNWGGNAQENVGQRLQSLIGTIGENMVIKRYARFELGGSAGRIESYIHLGGKVGVMVEILASDAAIAQGDKFEEFRKDVAMHIAAAAPDYVHADQIPSDVVARERDIAEARTREEGKPEHVVANIVEGRIRKWKSDVVLLMQGFVKNPDQNIEAYIKETGKAAGGEYTVRRFARFAIGG